MSNEQTGSLSAINTALGLLKQEKVSLVEKQVSVQIANTVKEGKLIEDMDLDKAKRIAKMSPTAEQAALEVIQELIANPKANKSVIIAKAATKFKTTPEKVEQLFNAIGMFGETSTTESVDSVESTYESVTEENTTSESTKTEAVDEGVGIVNEDWMPLARVHPKDVEKVKTKKSGNNYLHVVSFDQKSKEFQAVTPKQFEEGNTDKTVPVSFADVVMVSTDDMPEDGAKKFEKKLSGSTVHTSKHSDVDDTDESTIGESIASSGSVYQKANSAASAAAIKANKFTDIAGKKGTPENHKNAARAHKAASDLHRSAVVTVKDLEHTPEEAKNALSMFHQKEADTHQTKSNDHNKMADA